MTRGRSVLTRSGSYPKCVTTDKLHAANELWPMAARQFVERPVKSGTSGHLGPHGAPLFASSAGRRVRSSSRKPPLCGRVCRTSPKEEGEENEDDDLWPFSEANADSRRCSRRPRRSATSRTQRTSGPVTLFGYQPKKRAHNSNPPFLRDIVAAETI